MFCHHNRHNAQACPRLGFDGELNCLVIPRFWRMHNEEIASGDFSNENLRMLLNTTDELDPDEEIDGVAIDVAESEWIEGKIARQQQD